jgi:protein-disulfide reductase (glutathione)
MHADWCPHCRNYSHVFEDPRIVARARQMEMVRVNVDHEPDVANRFQLDGTYVPRTYFVAADGTPINEIDAHRPRYRYFYDERDPGSLLAAMDAALARR